MSRFVRAVLAAVVAVSSVGLALSQAGFAVVGGAIGVRVGVPGAFVELARALLPILVALFVAVFLIRFAIRTIRERTTLREDVSKGGKLVAITAWGGFGWLVVELLYRQLYLGWATLFGDLATSLVCSAVVVALAVAVDRLVPWSRAPRGLGQLGLVLVVALALLTALSAWSHRDVVSPLALLPVLLVGVGLLVSGVIRVEQAPIARSAVELTLAALLFAGPMGRLLS